MPKKKTKHSSHSEEFTSISLELNVLSKGIKKGKLPLAEFDKIEKKIKSHLDNIFTFRTSNTDPYSTPIRQRLNSKRVRSLLHLRHRNNSLYVKALRHRAEQAFAKKDFKTAIRHLNDAVDAMERLSQIPVHFHISSKASLHTHTSVGLARSDIAELQELNRRIYNYSITAITQSKDKSDSAEYFQEALRAKGRILSRTDFEKIESATALIGEVAEDIFQSMNQAGLLTGEKSKLRTIIIEAIKAIFYGIAASGLFEYLKMLSIRDPYRQSLVEKEIDSSCKKELAKTNLDSRLNKIIDPRLDYESFYSAIKSFATMICRESPLLDRFYEDILSDIELRLKSLSEDDYDISFERALFLDLKTFFKGIDWIKFETAFLEKRVGMGRYGRGRHIFLDVLVEDYVQRHRRFVDRLFLLRSVLESPNRMDTIYEKHMISMLTKVQEAILPDLLKKALNDIENSSQPKEHEQIIKIIEMLTDKEYDFDPNASEATRAKILQNVKDDLKDMIANS
jgi:hypothetical protein